VEYRRRGGCPVFSRQALGVDLDVPKGLSIPVALSTDSASGVMWMATPWKEVVAKTKPAIELSICCTAFFEAVLEI
jgi:hypothetical protein